MSSHANKNRTTSPRSLEDMMAAFSPGELERRIQQTSTPKGRIQHFQNIAAKEYPVFTAGLDPYMRQFFLNHRAATVATTEGDQSIPTPPLSFPAVDLGAGSAYYTVQWALRYRVPPSFEAGAAATTTTNATTTTTTTTTTCLEWYPTDIEGILEQTTRPCLQYMKEEAAKCAFLGTDRNGSPLYPNNRIVLKGLSSDSEAYNGKEGRILCRDPSSQGRYAINLGGTVNLQPMTFKGINLVKQDVPENAVASLEEENLKRLSMEQGKDAAILYDGLLERSCVLDLLRQDTWCKIVEKLRGTCALVTSTSLLSAIGYHEPDAWKNVMDVATSLLTSGGFLMQYDRTKEGHFGDVSVMEGYATPIGLILKHKIERSPQQTFLLWQMR